MKSLFTICLALLVGFTARAQITLQAYRDSVAAYSNRIAISQAQVARARADADRARTDRLPRLSASGSFTTDFRHSDAGDRWGFAVQPRIEQTIYGGGAVRAAVRQSALNLTSSEQSERATWLEVRYDADYAYWNLSAMQLYMAATSEYVSIIESLYGIVEERFRQGYVAKSDLLQVEARLSEARYSLIEIRNDYDLALHRFNSLRGVERAEQRDVVLATSITDSIAMPRRVGIDEMLARRPDMRIAELAVAIAEQGVASARARYNPQLTAAVSGSWQTYSPNVSGRTYWDGALVVGLSVPIFHWGERRYAVAGASADVRRALSDRNQRRRDATLEEADGWSAIENSYSQMRSSLSNLDIAGENLSISTFSYHEGQATVLDVLQAQISWIQIYTNAITARFRYAVAVSEYRRLTVQ